jgi:hypothetical protein
MEKSKVPKTNPPIIVQNDSSDATQSEEEAEEAGDEVGDETKLGKDLRRRRKSLKDRSKEDSDDEYDTDIEADGKIAIKEVLRLHIGTSLYPAVLLSWLHYYYWISEIG